MAGTSISNEELLSSLITDFQRGEREAPSLRRPDAIVVSGDLVEGLSLGAKGYPEALEEQYEIAEQLLISLVDEFLEGNRSRVVIVPGNHDVDWNGVRKAFQTEENALDNPRGFLNDPESNYRWAWKDRKVLRISDMEQYERRFEYFNEMYNRFYYGVQLAHAVDPCKPWNLFSLDGGNIIVAAFNSCVVNDCFSDFGHIRSKDIADCHLAMRPLARPGCLPVAVWHHGVGGPPWASDYLDPITVKLMVDKGFRLALHGHRHDSSISPLDLFVSTKETLSVIGAGSLCAGEKALPHGVNHRYNVIQIDRKENTGLVHVREMNQPGIWGPGQLVEAGGNAYIDFKWTTSSLEMPDQGRSGGYNTALVDEVERMINSGRSAEAIEFLQSDSVITDPYRRRLLGKALENTENWSELRSLFKPPHNDEELAMFYAASERSGDMVEVSEVLESSEASGEFDAQLVTALKQRLRVWNRLGGA